MRHLFAVSLGSWMIASAATAAPAPKESWGKAGITLAQYRQDSLECGLKGYYTDISKTDDAKAFVNASKQLDAITTGASAPMTLGSNATGPDTTVDQMAQYADEQQHIVDNVRPDERFKSIKKTLESAADQCLISRGYSKFELTDDQRHALRHLKAGSDQRRQYLYSLASNPTVLQSQRAP
ncbi:MAG TPA: hypothetical protein VE968_03340 [Sphingomicrobium sp.]|nr:hypothetical protein [Sphingomicrobium sp.]